MMQLKAYNHAMQKGKEKNVQWMMILDVDEFIMTSGNTSLLSSLFSHTMTPTVGALQLHWQFIVPPSKGFLYKPQDMTFLELLTQGFRSRGYSHPRCTTKSIVKVASAVETHVHYSKFRNITSVGRRARAGGGGGGETTATAAAKATATKARASKSTKKNPSSSSPAVPALLRALLQRCYQTPR